MFFGLPDIDNMKEDMLRQKFVHSLVSHHIPSKNAATNTIKNDVVTSNTVEPVVSLRPPSRIEQLNEKIKLVQEKLDSTEEKIKQSESSKKQLIEKLKMLETKISPASILITNHPTEDDIEKWNRLAEAFKSRDERAKKIKELELKERTMREGFTKIFGKRLSSSSLNQ